MASDPQVPGSSKGKIHSFGEKKKGKNYVFQCTKKENTIEKKKGKGPHLNSWREITPLK